MKTAVTADRRVERALAQMKQLGFERAVVVSLDQIKALPAKQLMATLGL